MKELLDNIESIKMLVNYIMPGCIFVKVYNILVPCEEKKARDYIIEIILYSYINEIGYNVVIQEMLGIYLPMYFRILILPVILSVMVVYLSKNKTRRKAMKKSWDFYFQFNYRCFILVHLNDNSMVGGLFSKQSFASAYPQNEDIYIQEVWEISNKGEFKNPIEDTLGVWISKENIKYVEFFSAN